MGTVAEAGIENVGSWYMRMVATIFEVPVLRTSGSNVIGAPGVGVLETTDNNEAYASIAEKQVQFT